jgi:hypothetical protein
MKKTFTKNQVKTKLAGYSALASAFVLTAVSANGQIQYTDVDPDESYDNNGDFYELDLNMDGDVDFTISIYTFTYPGAFYTSGGATFDGVFKWIWANPYNGSIGASTTVNASYTFAFPYAKNEGAAIDDGLSWQNLSNQSMVFSLGVLDFPAPGSTYAYSVVGNWSDKSDKFLPLLLDDGGSTYYGWARFDVEANNQEFTIKDYAVQGVADASIDAGQDGVGIHNVIQNNELTAYSFGNTINIAVKDLKTQGATVKVFDISGKVVYTNNLDLTGMTITLDKAATGNYTLQVVTEENSVFTKKLFVQN